MTANKGSAEPALPGLLGVLLDQVAIDPEFAQHLGATRDYLDAALRGEGHEGPFLSVIMRTQGRRLEAFADALLCLAAQTDQDFELIVVAHDVDDSVRESIASIIEEHADLLPPGVQLVTASGGTRSRPLNEGVARARGSYTAFFDDDDLLFAHWVESFHAAASEEPGRLFHAVSAIQRISPQRWPDGRDGFRTLSWAMPEYALEFDSLRNYLVNHSPFMSIAFPRALFTTLGFRFDETLDVCEDWEVILRGSSLLGIESVQHLTSIYRRWEDGGASSYTQHSREEWKTSERRLIARLDAEPALLPPGSVSRVRGLIRDENASRHLADLLSSKAWRVTAPARKLSTAARVALNRIRSRRRR